MQWRPLNTSSLLGLEPLSQPNPAQSAADSARAAQVALGPSGLQVFLPSAGTGPGSRDAVSSPEGALGPPSGLLHPTHPAAHTSLQGRGTDTSHLLSYTSALHPSAFTLRITAIFTPFWTKSSWQDFGENVSGTNSNLRCSQQKEKCLPLSFHINHLFMFFFMVP